MVLASGVLGCNQPTQPQPYVPRYTADQVVYIVSAKYPVAYKRHFTENPLTGVSQTIMDQSPTSITASYIDTAVWKVVVDAPQGHFLSYATLEKSKTLYFYESDAGLYTGYNGTNKTLSR